jgi:hypothetical protein
VRLNPEEMAELEALAERRNLPVSTVAREQILRLLANEQQPTQANPILDVLNDMTRLGGIAEQLREHLSSLPIPVVLDTERALEMLRLATRASSETKR